MTRQMLKDAADIARNLKVPKPRIYWADLIMSATLGYSALAAAILLPGTLLVCIAVMVAVFAIYRAGSFIHELTHLKRGAVPGFRTAWNLLVGVPLLIPSFLYEGVHNQHHARRYYGTSEDPDYLPLARMRPWTLPTFLMAAALAPIGLLARFAVLTPLSLVSPKVRTAVVARYSALQINSRFRRLPPRGKFYRDWALLEAVCSIWAISLLSLTATGSISLRSFLICVVIASGAFLLNQMRTLAAHLWENDGQPVSVTEQFCDSVNVPPPGFLPALWAPVGSRYHALHHLLPGVPYHNLGEVHRRLCRELEPHSVYHQSTRRSLSGLVARLVARSWQVSPRG